MFEEWLFEPASDRLDRLRESAQVRVCVCVCVCVCCARVRACMRARVRACRACVPPDFTYIIGMI